MERISMLVERSCNRIAIHGVDFGHVSLTMALSVKRQPSEMAPRVDRPIRFGNADEALVYSTGYVQAAWNATNAQAASNSSLRSQNGT
jgi:hypothetical protein